MSEALGSLQAINIHPLTGARANSVETAVLGPGGLVGDRVFVLYDPATGERVSQKQCPIMAQLTAEIGEDGTLTVERDPALADKPWKLVIPPSLVQAGIREVLEFGDFVPCHDVDDREYNGSKGDARGSIAAAFTELLGREVRLACKSGEWLAGGVILPAERAVATVHFGVVETVQALGQAYEEKTGQAAEFGVERLRAELVLAGFPAFTENEWIGGMLQIGERAYTEIDRPTERCKVPGTDQRTGVDMKDLPKVYLHDQVAKGRTGKPAIGVYGHPVGEEPVTISVGDAVRYIGKE